MSVDRVAVLALAAALLRLNIVQADVACATHEHSLRATDPAAQHEVEHTPSDADPAHEHPMPDSGEPLPCDSPGLPECCEALASCSPVLGDVGALLGEPGLRLHCLVPTKLTGSPVSRIGTPDPPPPRV